MDNDFELKPSRPRLTAAVRRWRDFCQQWRHGYLLLVAMFWLVWRVSLIALPGLDHIRLADGRHPLDVLVLMADIRNGWAPVAAGAALYALSFAIRRLNTASAVAAAALAGCAMLAMELSSAMATIGLW